MEKYLTVKETAEILRLSDFVVREWLKEGKLRGAKFGNMWRISEDDIRLFFWRHMGDEMNQDNYRYFGISYRTRIPMNMGEALQTIDGERKGMIFIKKEGELSMQDAWDSVKRSLSADSSALRMMNEWETAGRHLELVDMNPKVFDNFDIHWQAPKKIIEVREFENRRTIPDGIPIYPWRT